MRVIVPFSKPYLGDFTYKGIAQTKDNRPEFQRMLSQPAPDTLVKMAEDFGVSTDYLLTGINAENININAVLGLSEDAITMLKSAHEYDKVDFFTILRYFNCFSGMS